MNNSPWMTVNQGRERLQDVNFHEYKQFAVVAFEIHLNHIK